MIAAAGAGRPNQCELRNFLTTADISPVSLALLNYKFPNGQYLFPSANPNFTPTLNFPENVFLTQPAYFISIRPSRIWTISRPPKTRWH